MEDKEFLNIAEMTEGDNHRPLLLISLELTADNQNPVAEFGAGTGSTPYLRKYCEDAKRKFVSFDSNKEWAEKWGAEFVEDWVEDRLYREYSMVLIDQAPGEFRKESIKKLKDLAEIIVIHDSEPVEANGYALDEIWGLFKYKIVTKGEKIWTTAVSNVVDFSALEGMLIGNHKIENQQ